MFYIYLPSTNTMNNDLLSWELFTTSFENVRTFTEKISVSRNRRRLGINTIHLRRITSTTGMSLSATSGTLHKGPRIDRGAHVQIVSTTQELNCDTTRTVTSVTELDIESSRNVRSFHINVVNISVGNIFSPAVLVKTRGTFRTHSTTTLLFGTSNGRTLFRDNVRQVLIRKISKLLVVDEYASPIPCCISSPMPIICTCNPSHSPSSYSITRSGIRSKYLTIHRLLSYKHAHVTVVTNSSRCSIARRQVQNTLGTLRSTKLRLTNRTQFNP